MIWLRELRLERLAGLLSGRLAELMLERLAELLLGRLGFLNH